MMFGKANVTLDYSLAEIQIKLHSGESPLGHGPSVPISWSTMVIMKVSFEG